MRALVGQPGYRLRVGDWRAIFVVDTIRREVHVQSIAHRRDVYRR